MYIHGTRGKVTQSRRSTSLDIETNLSIEEEEAKGRVKNQNQLKLGLMLCCSPRFFGLFGAVLILKIGVVLVASI
ncbi:MAG: hypothetical protein WCQ26_09900, partial [Pseudanabaena sp. ELA748]